jgi:phospholipase C
MSVQNIETVILLMFENRSFDHMLGHLSFENILSGVNGLQPPTHQDAYVNLYQGGTYYPFHRPVDEQLDKDLPHEYDYVAQQLFRDPDTGVLDMNGFVEAYVNFTKLQPNLNCDPMGFFGSDQVPVTSFLARTFCTCDRWHCPLPTSTQPNRTVAFCGHSGIYETKLQRIPVDGNIFKWLEDNQIDWGVYSDGLPFFALYVDLWPYMFSRRFHHYEQLATDLKNGKAPKVIIVEPSYQDGPHIPPDHPNCNHPPLVIGWGENFLLRTYQAATVNPDVWAKTLMAVYYDEHGGFYDHAVPPDFDNRAAGNTTPPPKPLPGTNGPPVVFNFDSLGPRIPGILISPWVKPGVNHDLYDHTSVLQFLAERFTPGQPYSPQVANRAAQGIQSISTALADTSFAVPAPVAPPAPPFARTAFGDNIAVPPSSGMGQSFEAAALKMLADAPTEVDDKFPLLNNWKIDLDQHRPAV